jgi:hypothetical protein
MDFAHSPKALDLRERLGAFMQRYVLPYNAAWHAAVQGGVYPPPFLEDLKALARDEGLWNLFLPTLARRRARHAPEQLGLRTAGRSHGPPALGGRGVQLQRA